MDSVLIVLLGGVLRSISFLAFSQGWIGCILGGAFFLLALFNFFLIYRVRPGEFITLRSLGNDD